VHREQLIHVLDAIRPFLAGQAFEPEVIREMSLALEAVCAKLALKLTDDPVTWLVTSKIAELAQRGVRDATTLSTMTLKEFNVSI
jgi:2-C-methyl-D-erythritol 4-phosphate cytidylyltransferase